MGPAATMDRVAGDALAVSATCPHSGLLPVMEQDWANLSFLHWRYPPDQVRELLPAGLTLETFDGSAWIGLVPFLLRVRIPRGPALPWVGVFPETNVRTYVRGPDGQPGIWFLSLDAPRRLAIWAARHTYHLPYHVAAMRLQCDGDARTYTSWRLSGAHRGATSRVQVTVGKCIVAADVTPLEHFLTSRWRLFAPLRDGIGTALVDHAPYALRRATACDVDARLLVAAGLPHATAEPLVHACDDVRARLTRLVRCDPSPWQTT